MPDRRFEEHFLPNTPENTFGDETLENLLDAFIVYGPWHPTDGQHTDRTYMHETS